MAEPDNKDTKAWQGTLIEQVGDVMKKAMEGAPAWLKIVLVIAVAGLLVVALLIAQLFKAEGGTSWSAVLIAVIILIFPLLVIVLILRALKPSPAAWSRSIPKWPLEPDVMAKLNSLLMKGIQKHAYEILHTVDSSLEDRQIRANVFLGDYRQANQGMLCMLKMPDQLQINMNYEPERQVEFQPGQGATGVAFNNGRRTITHRLSTDAGPWEAIYPMTDAQKDAIHKDLKWIISWPLQDAQGETLGVLNLDGLDHEFSDDTLNWVAARLRLNIRAFEEKLAEQPRVTLTIHVEEKGENHG